MKVEIIKIPKFRYLSRSKRHTYYCEPKGCRCMEIQWDFYPDFKAAPSNTTENPSLKKATYLVKVDGEKWKQDAKMNGRAHSLNRYDDDELETTVNEEVYYIYRTN